MTDQLKKNPSKVKRPAPIDPAISLSDALARLTKDELSEIRIRLEIKGASSLKKADLIEKLEAALIQDMDGLLHVFNEPAYELVKELVSQDGCTAAGKWNRAMVSSVCELGIVFTGSVDGKESLIMPAELVAAVREADESSISAAVKRNTEWCLLTNGMLLYYGALRLQDMCQLLAKYTGEAAEESDVFRVMSHNRNQYDFRMDDNGFSSLDVEDSVSVLKEQDSRPTVDFYPFTMGQLLRTGEAGFIERNEEYRSFAAFLATYYDMNREEAIELTDICATNIQAGVSLQDIVAFLNENLDMDEQSLRLTVDRLVPFMNGTRQWALKGYAPSDLSAKRNNAPIAAPARAAGGVSNVFSIQTGKKVGRNEPCPCGSGKKFKKCCGA